MSEEIYINTGNTFQQPYTARVPANAQTPVSARQPARQPAQGRTPFTYQNRSPFTYRNPVSGQQPYIANAQAPYPYIANSQTPYIANAQQPYPYIANAQQPYIANAQSPFTYQARTPFTYNATGRTPFTYNNRSPFTYTRQGRSPFTYSAQNPFTYQARTPFTYNARQPFTYNARTPFTYNARQPASAIGTQSVPYFDAEIATDYKLVAQGRSYYTEYSGFHLSIGNPSPALLFDRLDISGSLPSGNPATSLDLGPGNYANTYTPSSTIYGVTGVHYISGVHVVNPNTTVATLQLIIANTFGTQYNSSAASGISNLQIWTPAASRSGTATYQYNVSAATSASYGTVTRWNGSTYISDQCIYINWYSGVTMSVLFGTSSNANWATSGYANGLYRIKIN
jgi:hypothetical protein